ncbi:SusD/RagB family nutrient-binding outer membrane lipoprotein [Zunongwangia profunda]|uniref:SusD/RagB family nutrient-binding outer membrane lipoprotein n=1 Tax=Zunongwangia profunda TaxID=398743 RepID=UPI001D195779|nr:SusD/RagB family nutrient-binding outer membrane lipoprotein [Zunongwangia profunda]MCC4228204.1 SusD/RagB family nutrient-binding outer membrane lipoprotein [Zunongwangia profunda]
MMKKYILTFIALATLWSCQTDEQYQNHNQDPKNPTDVGDDFLFTSSVKNLQDQLASPNVNFNIFRFISQYWTATTYLDEPNYNLNNRGIPDNHWSQLYRTVIFNIQDAKERVQNNEYISEGEINARTAQLELIEIYTWQILVDTFGNIPYSDALQARENTLPKYDDAQEIYNDLISRVRAIDFGDSQGYSSADVIYGGDMSKWELFANSIQLRLGMRIADFNPSLSQEVTEEAYSNGVFSSNSDNAILAYEANPPNTNPLWEDLVQSGRSDYVTANTIVDIMNNLEDPRRTAYFDDNLNSGDYIGGTYGASNSFQNFTHVGEAFREPTHPGILMDYAEVAFLLSDAALNGYSVGSSAQEYYEQGITASILYWGGTQPEADSYLSQDDVSYNGSEQQLGTQFWIAMYDNPFQGWNAWRTYDAPEFNLPDDTGNEVPLRYTYPIDEQNLNEGNYNEASEAIGGDEQQTRIFWDVD